MIREPKGFPPLGVRISRLDCCDSAVEYRLRRVVGDLAVTKLANDVYH
jgi:hypothetical protein